MIQRLDYYDILGMVVPGVLLAHWIPICFPAVSQVVTTTPYPSAVDMIGFAAFVIFLGQLLQALVSIIEPFLYWTWGGRPSEQALKQGFGDRFPEDTAKCIRRKLSVLVGEEASDQSLFLFAMRRADGANPRVNLFNSLYAYHRVLVLVLVIAIVTLLASRVGGAAETWSWWQYGTTLTLLISALILAWLRAKQRAVYYVREVLLTAEHVLDLNTNVSATR